MPLVVKIIFLVLITICALISTFVGRVIGGKDYNKDQAKFKKIVKIRMACFLIMLVLLFVVVVL